MKIAFVVQRYGEEVCGGSEFLCRQVAERMARHWDVEVLTSCAVDYVTWEDVYPPGTSRLGGVTVRRFRVDFPRTLPLFARLSEAVFGGKTTPELEARWMTEQGPCCSGFLRFLDAHAHRYDAFIFFTYLYWMTCHGLPRVAPRSLLVPTAHDEPHFHLEIFRDVFRQARGLLFNTPEEQELVRRRFDFETPGEVVGVGIEAPEPVDVSEFRAKYRERLTGPYVLYLGRIDTAKGCPELVDFFLRYRREHPERQLQLAMVGKRAMPLPKHPDLVELGFVTHQEKQAALAGAELLVMPSPYESLSLVTLEAWSAGTAVLANGNCRVLEGQCRRSQAGLTYRDYDGFKRQLNLLLQEDGPRRQLGKRGRSYVLRHYGWDAIEAAYRKWATAVSSNPLRSPDRAEAPQGTDGASQGLRSSTRVRRGDLAAMA